MTEACGSGLWSVHKEDSVDSTQQWVRDRLSILPDRSVVLAGTQSEGRGRAGRKWESPPGGLYASFLWKPAPAVEHAAVVSLVAALALADILEDHGIHCLVKWPNDVVISDKKVAGIIAESGGRTPSWLIMGMGANLRTVPAVTGRVVLPPGAWIMFGEPPEPEELLWKLINRIELLWPDREEDPIAGIIERLNSRLWNLGKEVTLQAGDDMITGVIEGLRPDGSLILSTDSGERRFVSGELLTVH